MTDFLRLFSWQFLLTLRVFARNLPGGNRRRNTFRISFQYLAWDSNPGFSSNKPTHYLLDHGDFNCSSSKHLITSLDQLCMIYLYIIYTRCDCKITVIFNIFQKVFIYLFFNNYPVPFKVIPPQI